MTKNWNQKPQVIKGDIGEQIIDNFLIDEEYHLFAPVKNRSHIFDRYAISITKNKHFYFDVKTKARFNNWEAQGVNEDAYLKYIEVSEKLNVPFYIFFIDENSGDVHSVDIIKKKDKLFHIPMKKESKVKIVAWLLKDMYYVGKIENNDLLRKMASYNTRNYPIAQTQTIPF
jgi:hypothetical protein